MFATNGRWRSLKQMLMLASWKRSVRAGWTRLQELPWGELLVYGAMLIVLGLALTGCAVTSTPPSVGPRVPEPPPTRLSESPPGYLKSVQDFLSKSQKTLQELITKPAN